MLRRTLIPAILVSIVVFASFPSFLQAEIIWDFQNPPTMGPTIEEVNAAGGLRVGDKVFSMFTVSPTALNTTLVPDITSIRLTGVLIEGELGIRFDGLWSAGAGQLADTVIVFKAVADEPWLIHDNTLKMAGYLADNGGLVTISETVYARNPNEFNDPSLAQKGVYYDSASGARKEIDHKFFTDPQTGQPVALSEVWILKDVGANGGLVGQEGIAKISSFYQTFSQIPEPMTMLLLGAGVIPLLRRRKK